MNKFIRSFFRIRDKNNQWGASVEYKNYLLFNTKYSPQPDPQYKVEYHDKESIENAKREAKLELVLELNRYIFDNSPAPSEIASWIDAKIESLK